MKNIEIRNLIKKNNIYHYEIASKLSVSESTLVRKFRNDLSEYDKNRILDAISIIIKERNYDINS